MSLIFRSRKLRTASNRLLLSLLSADFVILLCCYAAASQGLQRSPFLGKLGSDDYYMFNWYNFNFCQYKIIIITIVSNFIGCKIYGVCSSVGAFAEIWSLAAVSWDRYQAVFNPFNQLKRITKCQVIKLHYILYIFIILLPYNQWTLIRLLIVLKANYINFLL